MITISFDVDEDFGMEAATFKNGGNWKDVLAEYVFRAEQTGHSRAKVEINYGDGHAPRQLPYHWGTESESSFALLSSNSFK